jgi:hypothetical protein
MWMVLAGCGATILRRQSRRVDKGIKANSQNSEESSR